MWLICQSCLKTTWQTAWIVCHVQPIICFVPYLVCFYCTAFSIHLPTNEVPGICTDIHHAVFSGPCKHDSSKQSTVQSRNHFSRHKIEAVCTWTVIINTLLFVFLNFFFHSFQPKIPDLTNASQLFFTT
jgi:hypothetical protein